MPWFCSNVIAPAASNGGTHGGDAPGIMGQLRLLFQIWRRVGMHQESRALRSHLQKGARGGHSGQRGQDGSVSVARVGAGSCPPARGCGRGGGGGRLYRWPGSPVVPAAAVTSAGSAAALAGRSGASLSHQTLQ